MSHSFEIRQRDTDEHRPNHFEMLIDGIDAEITVDPMQFMPWALLKAEGDPAKAVEICNARATHAIQRRINRLREGRVAAGIPVLVESDRKAKGDRIDEKEAVRRFLSRGFQKDEFGRRILGTDGKPVRRNDPRTKEESDRRRKARNSFHDHEAEWRDRRAKLIAIREQALADLQAEVAANPSKRGKLERDMALLRDELRALKPAVLAASHGFQYAYGQYLIKGVQLATDDIRIVPCMTNTTVDTERDAKDQVSDFTTLDEFDGAGYTTGGQALDNQAVNIDDANDRAEFDADDEAATLSAGTRSIQGNLLINFVTNLNSSLPLHWIEYASNKTPDGSTFTVVFNAEGILQAADG
jgi:hypothetical protein